MSGVTTIEQIAARLEECAERLLALNKSTEDDFLTIGSHLREVTQTTGEISSIATSAAGVINGEELKNDMAALQDLFARMEGYLKASDTRLAGSTETLGTILKEVEKAHSPLQGFKKIVKHLRMLAISTKIESARLVTGDGSFSTIADDVEKLSSLIDAKSADILHTINSLRSAIGDTLSRVSVLEKWEHGAAGSIVDSILRGLQSLSETYALSSRTASRIAEASEEIRARIGEIISSLQFHDITRQQIEHVLEALAELGREMAGLQNVEDPVSKAGEFYVSDVCGLQMSQLSNAKSELMSAVGDILKDLRGIARSGETISKEMTGLIGMSGSNDRSFLVRLKSDVATIISSLKENGEASRDLENAVSGVTRTIEDLSRFVGDIEDVGMEIELIALNARVRAAKTGNEGAALGVLAEGVRNLSDNSRAQTRTVSDTLTHVTDIAESLEDIEGGFPGSHGAAPGQDSSSAAAAEDMVDALNELLLSFSEIDSEVGSLIHRLEEASALLAARIDEVVSGVTAHEKTEQVLGEVLKEIEDVARVAGKSIPPAPGAEQKEAYLRRFEERYTMHRERYVHNARIPEGTRPLAEEESLGDNIEFF